MNILVLGGGGREHAITWMLSKSPLVEKLYVAPGNGGTAEIAENVSGLNENDGAEVLEFARAHEVTLVVVGPEAPLVAGVADALRAGGIAVFGPDAQGAQLEGSKTFCKSFMQRHGLPTASYLSTDDAEAAHAYIDKMGAPIVVKADGLAAGKGVVVADTLEAAHEAVNACFEGAFGKAGATVVIEECLTGPECSMLAFVSAGKAQCMAPSQDHKRAFDGDRGPNTGGMGAYSPVPIVTEDELAQMRQIMADAAAGTAADFDNDYRGVLYGGFMLTPAGPKLLEYNARFGDPETQVVLPRLKSDLAQVMLAVAEGRPDDVELDWSDQWAVTVVLASEGYPRAYEKGKVILGVDDAEKLEGVTVFHAGTALNPDGELVTSGGRVLDVTALGDTFEEARELAYQACELITFEGKQLRMDIGEKASRGREAWA
ncbi:MAG: phosphoribosylamine--glycine ligase [Eggerthellaceae bacterium]|nr:phosphoribosylamine--glycine ligase [Eggerthellaceae bacterium]